MDIALQKRRLFVALGLTTVALIVSLCALVALFALHLTWALWVFVGAILAGFASHGWLMLGLARDRTAP